MSAAAIVALGGLAALILGLVLYERTRGGARELGLVAVLVAAATAGRIAFAAIPSAQMGGVYALMNGAAGETFVPGPPVSWVSETSVRRVSGT